MRLERIYLGVNHIISVTICLRYIAFIPAQYQLPYIFIGTKIQQLEQSEDECGCPVDKCVPLPKPVSKCPCQECQMCSQIETGPTG